MSFVNNPYRNHKPVADPFVFCGRHAILSLIAENIRHGQMCAVAGEPLVGKTSLLYFLVHPKGAWSIPEFREHLNDPGRYLFVLIESGRLPTSDANGFFRYLFDRVVEEAQRPATDHGEDERSTSSDRKPGDTYETQQLLEQYLKRLEQRVVLLFDDFDFIAHFMHDDEIVKIMQKIRTLTQALDLQDKLNCIFVSTDSLGQLFQTKGFTVNSLFSKIIMDNDSLRPLDDDEIEQLIRKPLQQLENENITFTPEEIVFIKQLAGHHPAMVKTTCSHLFDAKSKKEPQTLFHFRQILEKDPYIQSLMDTQWQRLVQSEQQSGLPLSTCLIAIAQARQPEEPAALEILHKKGLIDNSAPDPWIWGDTFRNFVLRKRTPVRQNVLFSDTSNTYSGYRPKAPFAPMENKLFSYLAQNIERTCERAELHRVLWGDKPPRSRDALEQLIKRIREKIEPRPEYPEYLLTIRGQGYLLRENNAE